jgi:hypothetical protein
MWSLPIDAITLTDPLRVSSIPSTAGGAQSLGAPIVQPVKKAQWSAASGISCYSNFRQSFMCAV